MLCNNFPCAAKYNPPLRLLPSAMLSDGSYARRIATASVENAGESGRYVRVRETCAERINSDSVFGSVHYCCQLHSTMTKTQSIIYLNEFRFSPRTTKSTIFKFDII